MPACSRLVQNNLSVLTRAPVSLCGIADTKEIRVKVLIVDDSAALRQRLVEMLSKIKQLDIVGDVGNVSAAHDAVKALHPDLIVLDIRMGDGSGIDVLREVKRHNPATKVIILTNFPEPQYERKCTELGADFFLRKSTDSHRLVEISERLAAHLE